MLPWNENLNEEANLERLAGHLEQQIRNLAELPSRAAEREELELRAHAARLGQYLFDPRDIRGCDPATQRWRARCAAAGRTVRPDQFLPDGIEPRARTDQGEAKLIAVPAWENCRRPGSWRPLVACFNGARASTAT